MVIANNDPYHWPSSTRLSVWLDSRTFHPIPKRHWCHQSEKSGDTTAGLTYNWQQMHFPLVLLPIPLSVPILFVLALYGWSKRQTLFALPYAAIMLLGGLWGLASTLQLASASLTGKVAWERLHFLSTAIMPVVLFRIVLESRGRSRWAAPWPFAAFLLEPAFIVAVALSGWGGRLFMSGFEMEASGVYPVLDMLRGPLYWVHVIYTYVLLTGSLFLLSSWARDSLPPFRRQARHVLGAILLPIAVDVLFHFGITPVNGVEYTPAAMTVTGVLAALALFRFRMQDIIPIASRLIVRTMRELTLVVDANDHLVDFNPSAREIMGLDPRRLTGRPLSDLPTPWDSVFAPFKGVPSTRETVRVPLRWGVRWYHLSVSTPLDESGSPVGRLFVLHDVTERKEIEESLRESEEKFRGFVEESVEAIMLIDEEGRIIEFNPGAERMTGLHRDDVLGMKMWRLMSITAPPDKRGPEYGERMEAGFRAALRSGATDMLNQPIEDSLVRPDGERRHFRQYVFPIRTPRGFRLGSVSHDITEAKEAEEALARSREQLQQALKMEAIGRLAGGIAHDFNNLLTVIGGYCELVEGALADGTAMKDQVREISRAARRATELTAQLLAFGRKQVMQLRVVAVNELVANMEKMLARVIGEDIRLVTSLHPDAGYVRVDPGRLEQVIMNLAVNARDAMSGGGTLAIETRNSTLDDGHVGERPDLRRGSYVKLSISDTGTGMDTATRERIFEPFFTTKPVGKGTGLGLPTAYGIVTQSDGHIFCDSEPGKGSTFSIYLPRVPDGRASLGAAAAVTAEAAQGRETILLVEDDATVRAFTRSLLSSKGYTVIEAPDGEEALAEITAERAGIDLLVTDVVMPRMSGPELARAVRASCPDLRVLFVSGYAESAFTDRDGLGPRQAFVQKPFSSTDFLSKIRQMLDNNPTNTSAG
jgi:PAS domain S-box-containing protein